MAPEDWRTGIDLRRALAHEPERFELMQLVRLLESLVDGPPPSAGADPARAAVRFRGGLDPAFPRADIAGARIPTPGLGETRQARIDLAALSFGGPQGPMPDALMQDIRDRARAGDTGGAAFLDIFIHRLMTLMWRTRRAMRPDLETRAPGGSTGGRAVLALAGLPVPSARGRAGVPDGVLMRHAPLLARRPVSAEALRRIVADHLDAPVRIDPLQGRWLTREPDELTRLGRADGTARLGNTTVLGRRVWSQAGGLRLDIGPLTRDAFMRTLPGQPRHDEVRALLRFAVNQPMTVTARLRLRHDQVPPLRLSSGDGPRLGWTSWLGHGLDIGRHRRVTVTMMTSADVAGAA